ncbi:Hypothetical protein PMT_2789 [Prochlorococcus marinus str. MIT 9313]|uniref:Uncharacterized protein n=1 Tax=Prochlorococcus marinus (strain MIT 9313) TaxID=74547 RepID=B9ESG2_PROMM|nr:Hypothetical protein PMT_2789 [Prochlorococcus marinus str. MIT 9313]
MQLLTKQLFKRGLVFTDRHQLFPPRKNLADGIGATLPVHLRSFNEAKFVSSLFSNFYCETKTRLSR